MATPTPPKSNGSAAQSTATKPAAAPPVATGTRQESPRAPLPLLYKKPEALDRDKHGSLRLRAVDDYSAARNAGLAPIVITEFAAAAQFYPIVFLNPQGGRAPMPVAVLGPKPEVNLYVGADGRWKSGHYIPAYFRRYPFITSDAAKDGRALIMLDAASDKLSATEGTALFEKGEPTQLTKTVIDLCQQFHQAGRTTEQFSAALEKAGALVDRAIQATGPGGAKLAWRGMKGVDGEKLNQVPWQTFLEWRDKNWLAPIYLHQFSLNHFGALAAQKMAQDSADAGKGKK